MDMKPQHCTRCLMEHAGTLLALLREVVTLC